MIVTSAINDQMVEATVSKYMYPFKKIYSTSIEVTPNFEGVLQCCSKLPAFTIIVNALNSMSATVTRAFISYF